MQTELAYRKYKRPPKEYKKNNFKEEMPLIITYIGGWEVRASSTVLVRIRASLENVYRICLSKARHDEIPLAQMRIFPITKEGQPMKRFFRADASTNYKF